MGKDSGITIKDIGRMAGVSHSTVSRALNDHPQVNAETRERIKALARSVNFEFNAGARSLSSRKTGVVGIIYPSKLDSFGCSLYTNELFRDLRREFEGREYDVILVEAYNSSTGQSNIDRLIRQRKVDGFILVHRDIHPSDYALIRSHEIPLLQLHYPADRFTLEGIDQLLTDNRKGGALAAEALVSGGCRQLLCIGAGSCTSSDEMAQRFEGFHSAAVRHGADCRYLASPSYDAEDARITVLKNREMIESADGVFALTDVLAFGILAGLKEQGVRIPGHLQIIGFDDSPLCTIMKPELTSVYQPRREMAAQACSLILDRITGTQAATAGVYLLSPRLIRRETTL